MTSTPHMQYKNGAFHTFLTIRLFISLYLFNSFMGMWQKYSLWVLFNYILKSIIMLYKLFWRRLYLFILFVFLFSVMNIFQGVSALLCIFTIAKEFGEHHFHELSGKTDIPSIGIYYKPSIVNYYITSIGIYYIPSKVHCIYLYFTQRHLDKQAVCWPGLPV